MIKEKILSRKNTSLSAVLVIFVFLPAKQVFNYSAGSYSAGRRLDAYLIGSPTVYPALKSCGARRRRRRTTFPTSPN